MEESQESLTPIVINEDKRSIQEEEREKILNVENEQKNTAELNKEKKPMDVKEGMEVKPKKIPIGGIQMPGFFTRSKSKEQCKEEDQAEGTELIEQEEKKVEETPVQSKIKLPNPFKKSKPGDVEEGGTAGEPKDRIKLLETIRLPLVSVFQRIRRGTDPQGLSNTQTQAGLASTETLEEKSNDGKSYSELKSVPLEEKVEPDKQEVQSDMNWTQTMKKYKIAIGSVLFFLLALIIICIILVESGNNIPRTPPVRDGKYVETTTSCGRIEGKLEDSSIAFRGVPYARPPTGPLRFKYAQPLDKIDYCWNGTLQAHNATPTCLQVLDNGTVVGTEDCLTLDIVTPYVRYDNPLSVIVLIGADSFVGGSPGKMRPSARYARSRDVIFVRPNFRLGALGFLSLDILSRDDYPHTSGNYGLSDILVALQWIQLNIEHFGGDKRSVTLFGHRAGATMVTALATMPQAKKYFTRAWASSGGALYPDKSRTESEETFRTYLQTVGCQDVKCLRSLDAEKLVMSVPDLWRKPQPDLPAKDEADKKGHQWLVIDGKIVKEPPSETWSQKSLSVALMLGSTAQAGHTAKLHMKHTNWTEGVVRHHVKESIVGAKDLTEEALKKYEATYSGLSRMVTDIRIVCPLFEIWSQMNNVTFYVVNQTRGIDHLADIDSDIDAILGRYEPKTPAQRRYFSAMQGLFYHFVYGDETEQKVPGKQVFIVDQDISYNTTYSHCAFWSLKNIVPSFAALD